MKIIMEFPPTEPIVAMCLYKETVIVATTASLYMLVDGQMRQIEFLKFDEVEPEEPKNG